MFWGCLTELSKDQVCGGGKLSPTATISWIAHKMQPKAKRNSLVLTI